MMNIKIITDNKADYLPLLLLGDEQQRSIMNYIGRGELFALFDDDLRCVCAVTDEGNGTLEIQNLATDTRYQRQGYVSKMLEHVCEYYRGRYNMVIL